MSTMSVGSKKEKEKEIFTVKDHVLSQIHLPYPCPISIEITANEVTLNIGPRDIQWDRHTKKINGTGTFLGK